MPRVFAVLLVALAAVALAAPASASAENPWLGEKVLNMAHQGGEDELPSNTLYAFREAVARGADMLELDVSRTRDDRLVVMHDWTVDRTTDGTGHLTDLTLARVRRLDAAYNFVPGRNAVSGLPARRYPLRGVRTGDRRPPRGSARSDFRVPTLREVLRAFPHTPLNVEIKGRDDEPAEFLRNAELLADELAGTRRRDLIVVSFHQPAVDRFRALAPGIPVAPGVDGIAGFLLGGRSPGEGVAALQIPITFRFGEETLEVTTPESVLRAHAAGYAVHVWLSNDEENARVYDELLDLCVDGIMAARPRALERRLRARDVVRPDGRGTDPCSVRATGARVDGRAVVVRLARRGREPLAYAGRVVVRARGAVVARGRFALAADARRGELRMQRIGDCWPARGMVSVSTRGARGEPVRTRLRLAR